MKNKYLSLIFMSLIYSPLLTLKKLIFFIIFRYQESSTEEIREPFSPNRPYRLVCLLPGVILALSLIEIRQL